MSISPSSRSRAASSEASAPALVGWSGMVVTVRAEACTPCLILRHPDPALAHRVHDGLGPVVDGQFAEDGAHVILDRLLADRQGIWDLLIGHALGNVVEDLDLARRQRGENRRGLL